ncbi:MAG TPA: transporter substrate-binding domain-containing protein [Desulfobacterales bacterium]|jgi:signal transduction histidine kinase|nr:transporter substrate-binding domain-containing protein [Desulfobacterales bacterium]
MRFHLPPIILLLLLAAFPAYGDGTRLRVGVYDNIPLAYTDQKGVAGGFYVDLLTHIARREGWQIVYVPGTWPECLDNLRGGRIDLLGVIAHSQERARVFDYNYESVFTDWGQVYTNKRVRVESLLDLSGKKIAVLMDDIYFLNLRKILDQFELKSRFIEAFENEDVLKLVEIGKCDVGLVSQSYGFHHESRYRIVKTPIILSPQKLYWATPKNHDKELLFHLDHHLKRLKADEKSVYYQSLQKWFGIGTKPVVPAWARWVLPALVAMVLLAASTLWVFRRQLQTRTRELVENNRRLSSEIRQRQRAEKEREALVHKLQRAHKMEAIGTLAGGVAHDLNNILSGVVSYPELLLLDLPANHPLQAPLRIIKTSGEKAVRIVQDLLTLARRGVVVTEAVNLNQVVDAYLISPEYQKLLAYHPGVRLEKNLSRDLPNILGSPVHLSQTVMNLVSNAAEAMPHGGGLRVATENRRLQKPVKGYDEIAAGDYVVLTVADDGIGISSEDQERIFEPFYSKKVMGRSGTGLGMAVVWGTVKDHRGFVDIRSAEGQGTSISLYFPITRQGLCAAASPVALETFKGAGQSVLVVDDREDQRIIATQMLTKLGYCAASVSGGEEALAYLRQRPVDLLLLDMIMGPRMDGLETYRRIQKIVPGQKALIASGFSETERVRAAQALGAGEYLRKPYTIEAIGLAVKNALAP